VQRLKENQKYNSHSSFFQQNILFYLFAFANKEDFLSPKANSLGKAIKKFLF
jgi:hypothetical protein